MGRVKGEGQEKGGKVSMVQEEKKNQELGIVFLIQGKSEPDFTFYLKSNVLRYLVRPMVRAITRKTAIGHRFGRI